MRNIHKNITNIYPESNYVECTELARIHKVHRDFESSITFTIAVKLWSLQHPSMTLATKMPG